jgi:hypothetical protein
MPFDAEVALATALQKSNDPESHAQMYAVRQASLDQFLYENYTYHIRPDSSLAFKWCIADPELEPQWQDVVNVAHEIACMQTLHEHSDYTEVTQHALRHLATLLHKYGATWSQAWASVVQYAIPLIKLRAMIGCETRIPELVHSD